MADSNKQNSSDGEMKAITIWGWVQAICTVLFVFFILLKFYDASFEVDFSTLLSIILAIFSIWLSAMFYFKATETSNRFYEHTYNHSKGISELLVKIESGFGEKLSNLHENYSSIKKYIENPSETKREDIEDAMTKEAGEIEKIKQAQDKIINDLIKKANLAKQESENVRTQLKGKEQQLKAAENNISNLREELSSLNNNSEFSVGRSEGEMFLSYFSRVVYPKLLKNNDGSTNNPNDIVQLQKRFSEMFNTGRLDPSFVNDGIRLGYFNVNGEFSVFMKNQLMRLMK